MHLEIMEARDLDSVMSYIRSRKDLNDVFFVAGHMIMLIDCDNLSGLTFGDMFGKIIGRQTSYIDRVLFICVPI